MYFSDPTNLSGICERTRTKMRVDANQWSNKRIANSANDYLDKIFIAGIKFDKRFQIDDTNHTKLPIGTTNLVANQTDYSFLTDEQNNKIVTLTRIDIKDSDGKWTRLTELDENEETKALDDVVIAGTPDGYYKLADNVIRLNRIPEANVTAGIKFYFQRTPNYFVYTDTTKEPGVSPLLHKGFVAYCAYDGAETLGLQNLQPLQVRMAEEIRDMEMYFSDRNGDVQKRMTPKYENNR